MPVRDKEGMGGRVAEEVLAVIARATRTSAASRVRVAWAWPARVDREGW
jgi:hypothetical protein